AFGHGRLLEQFQEKCERFSVRNCAKQKDRAVRRFRRNALAGLPNKGKSDRLAGREPFRPDERQMNATITNISRSVH
ncbi:hypothetical protein, partial [Mesorhizobium sp. M2C.T.Ca.TU.002.02.1.1]|uniref:hypothetical protein n=1 Tax=Mesorhizobium sp. M2C.T.Ca.TU.002.02.1.1 TaxID=2496788 RepID=UPI0019D1CD1E